MRKSANSLVSRDWTVSAQQAYNAGTTHILLPDQTYPPLVYPLLVSILPYLASTLVVLDVSSWQLSSLPAELALCTALEELNVANNPLGALPPWLGDLTSMRV